MPIDQAIEEYVRFASNVFSNKKWGNKKEKFKASVFVTGMEAIIKLSGLSPKALLQDNDSEHCK
ncbi:hypothetical protein C0993_005151, partial [Termitomyces sp. T159_Od127]